MSRESFQPPPNTQPDERPWQFSLLHLFGLTTVVAVCAAAFYWSRTVGSLFSSTMFLSVATYYRAKAVVRTAAPSLRNRSLPSLIGFAVVTSFVASFAALVSFSVTCAAVVLGAIAAPWSADALVLGVGCVLGSIAGSIVLYRSWPSRPTPR